MVKEGRRRWGNTVRAISGGAKETALSACGGGMCAVQGVTRRYCIAGATCHSRDVRSNVGNWTTQDIHLQQQQGTATSVQKRERVTCD